MVPRRHVVLTVSDLKCFVHSTSDELRELPPSRYALREHTKRAADQAGWLWGNALEQKGCPPVECWGWVKDEDKLYICWRTIDCGQDLGKAIGTCSCTTNHCIACSCATRNLKCLIYCKCQQNCKNPSWLNTKLLSMVVFPCDFFSFPLNIELY